MINSKEELVSKIKQMARDLENRAEDIAVDWNKKITKINFLGNIEPDTLSEWDITKEYSVLPKRIDMKLEYDQNEVSEMKELGFDEIIVPAKLFIDDEELYCWYTIGKYKNIIELKNETFSVEYMNNFLNQTNEFYLDNTKYYISGYEYQRNNDNEKIYIEKLTFIEY